MNKIIIQVHGGVVNGVLATDKDTEIEIIDYDNDPDHEEPEYYDEDCFIYKQNFYYPIY